MGDVPPEIAALAKIATVVKLRAKNGSEFEFIRNEITDELPCRECIFAMVDDDLEPIFIGDAEYLPDELSDGVIIAEAQALGASMMLIHFAGNCEARRYAKRVLVEAYAPAMNPKKSQ